MMDKEREDRLQRIEDKIDKLDTKVDDYQLAVEHRVTVLETKAGFWGAITGFVAGLAPTLLFRK